MEEGLSLYAADGCAACQNVKLALAELGVEVEYRDVRREATRHSELVEARGRGTVPVLRIEEPDGDVRWMAESRDIIAYLYGRFSDGPPPRFGLGGISRALTLAMWALLLGGTMLAEPTRSYLWLGACFAAASRSVLLATKTGAFHHWAIALLFVFGGTSIGLRLAGLADLPWWYAAYALVALLFVGSLIRRRRAQ